MSTFYAGNNALSNGYYTATNERRFDTIKLAGQTVSANVVALTTVWTHCWTVNGAVPLADWPTTGYNFAIEITAAGADLTSRYQIARLQGSSHSSVLASADILTGQTGTGIKSVTNYNWSGVNSSGSRTASDAFSIAIETANSNMMTDESLVVGVGGTYTSEVLLPAIVKSVGTAYEGDITPYGSGSRPDSAVASHTASTSIANSTINTPLSAAQSFAPSESCYLHSIILSLSSVATTANLTVDLVTDLDSTSPIESWVLAPGDVAVGNTPAPETLTSTSNPLLIGGSTYYIRASTTETETWYWKFSNAGDYPGGQRYYISGGSWNTDPADDLEFEVRGTPGRSFTVTLTPNGPGGTLGITTETDAAQAFTKSKRKDLPVLAVTESAQPIACAKSHSLGQATETEAAQPVGRRKVKAVGTATETDLAFPITANVPIVVAVGTATETDTALPVGDRRAVGTAAETETAQPITARKSRVLGTVTETSEALTIGAGVVIAVGTATEAESAQSLGKRKVKGTTPATSSEAPVALSRAKSKAVSPASETDASTALTHSKVKAISPALETDETGLVDLQLPGLPVAQEADQALPFGHSKTKAVGTVAGGETAVPLDVSKRKALASVTEAETALPVGKAKRIAVGTAVEVEEVRPVTARKRKAVGTTQETDDALRITYGAIGVPGETDVALPIGVRKSRTVVPAQETETPGEIRRVRTFTVTAAVETDEATPVGKVRRITVSPVTEVELARPLTVPYYRFECPTYRKITTPPPLVYRPRVGFTQSVSVVRVNGAWQDVKTPSVDLLKAAGVEGEDYFLGGRIYEIPQQIANSLIAAGYTATEI